MKKKLLFLRTFFAWAVSRVVRNQGSPVQSESSLFRRKNGSRLRTGAKRAAWGAVVFFAGTRVFATLSEPVLVDVACRDSYWTTVFTNSVDLSWEWCTNAEKARLDIIGMGETVTTNFTKSTSNYLWRVFSSDVPVTEDVYDLTLTFSTDADVTVGALTSRLVVISGAFGSTAVNTLSNSPAWSRVKENVVIPYDASFSETATNVVSAQLVIAKEGGMVQTNTFADVAGYYGWKIRHSDWGYGTFDLALSFPGMTNVWTAEVMRLADGLIFSVH